MRLECYIGSHTVTVAKIGWIRISDLDPQWYTGVRASVRSKTWSTRVSNLPCGLVDIKLDLTGEARIEYLPSLIWCNNFTTILILDKGLSIIVVVYCSYIYENNP